MIFGGEDDPGEEPRPTPLYSACASVSVANSWTSINGWAAAKVYTSVEQEYAAMLDDAALVDLGCICRYTVRGPDASAMLARLTSAPVRELATGESARGLVLDADGFVADVADVARLSGDLFMLTTSAPIERRLQVAARGFDAAVEDITPLVSALGLVGPAAREVASKAGFDVPADDAAAQSRVRGVETSVRPIHVGAAPGVEILYPREEALTLWERVRRARRLPAAGVDAIEILRIEAGSPRPRVDFARADGAPAGAARRPAEIGVPHLAPTDRGWFNGRRALAAAKPRERGLVVFATDSDWTAPGSLVFAKDAVVGAVTSAIFSPRLRRALCFAEISASASGKAVEISATASAPRVAAVFHETPEGALAASFRANLSSATDSRRRLV